MIDKLYGKLFDKVFNEQSAIVSETKEIIDFIKRHPIKSSEDKSYILDTGTGTGKHYQYLNSGNTGMSVIGLERSQAMADIFNVRNPTGKLIMGDMRNENLFESEKFSYILCLKETFYHNSMNDWNTILSNFYFWLKPSGYLIIHLFDRDKLDPAPLNMSLLRKDAKKRIHSITNFPTFTHDGWWETRGKTVCQYNEIFALHGTDGKITKKRHYKHNLSIPPKDKIMEKIVENYFKLIEIKKFDVDKITDHELCFFKKTKN
jgi:SAM-dependent methyltransferase